jgi:hypothetical protein
LQESKKTFLKPFHLRASDGLQLDKGFQNLLHPQARLEVSLGACVKQRCGDSEEGAEVTLTVLTNSRHDWFITSRLDWHSHEWGHYRMENEQASDRFGLDGDADDQYQKKMVHCLQPGDLKENAVEIELQTAPWMRQCPHAAPCGDVTWL